MLRPRGDLEGPSRMVRAPAQVVVTRLETDRDAAASRRHAVMSLRPDERLLRSKLPNPPLAPSAPGLSLGS